MDFDLSADQEALRDAARDLLDDRCTSRHVRAAADAGGFDADLWSAMADQGWLAIAVDESHGGLGLGAVEVAVLLEQAGAHLAPVPLLQQILALDATADTDRADALVAGEQLACVARTALTRAGDGTVSGRTEPALYGARADVLIAPAGDELVMVGLSDTERSALPAMDRTRELARIELSDAPAVTIGGRDAVDAHLDRGAVYHAAELLGGAGAVLALAVDYAKQREQFGRPIGSFQAIKHRCADMLVDVEGMRSAVYHAAWTIGAGDPDAPVAAATAKIWCSDAGRRVAESALQVHGGVGFTWESDVHLFLKRAQLDEVAFGDARHHRRRLAAILRSRVEAGEPVLG